MDQKLLDIFEKANLPDHWTIDQKAAELGQYALEAGLADLPDLFATEPKIYDRAVEDAYEFFYGEAKHWLGEKK